MLLQKQLSLLVGCNAHTYLLAEKFTPRVLIPEVGPKRALTAIRRVALAHDARLHSERVWWDGDTWSSAFTLAACWFELLP